MQVGAKVESIDALAVFRVALVKFQEGAVAALGDAESDIQRTLNWLEKDQFSYWTSQIRSRQEALSRAQEALRQKQIFKDSTGRAASAVEEQKVVTKCLQKVNEAQEKMAAVKSWSKRLQKEGILYKGQVQRFVTSVTTEVPAAIGHLGALIHTLQEYAAMQAPGAEVEVDAATAAFFTAGGTASMSRGQAPAVETRPHVKLRTRAPSPEARANAPAVQPAPAAWAAPRISEPENKALAEMQLNWMQAVPSERIILARGAAQSDRIFLDRSRAAAAGDSGWFIAPIDPTDPTLESITVSELLAARPDLTQLLSLPPGSLAVIERTGLTAVLNDRDDNLLAKAKPA